MSNSPQISIEQTVIDDIKNHGLGLIPGVYSMVEIEKARTIILSNLNLMKNTRPNPSSRHLAGFHRYPELEPLHTMMTSSPLIKSYLNRLCQNQIRTIGLSDITINRSQQWHKDLLRGKYEHLLGIENTCSNYHGLIFKVIIYLQDSTSLHYLPGSHKQDISLENDQHSIPKNLFEIQNVSTRAGDAVILDICTTHRGATEETLQTEEVKNNPRILISTVFGAINSNFTDTMEIGNAIRLNDWMKRK